MTTSATVRKLQAEQAAAVDKMNAILAVANGENRDLNDAEQAEFTAAEAAAGAFKARINRQQAADLAAAGVVRDAGGTAVEIGAARTVSVSENVDSDPKRGFANMGEYAQAVIGASAAVRNGGGLDKRLMGLGGYNAAAPSTFGGEGVGADGGFLVPVEFGTTIFQASQEEQALLPLCDNMPVTGNAMSFPKDETTPWGSNGIRAYWQGEATAGTPTKPVLGRAEFKLKKLLALVPLSEELMADTAALNAYVPPNMARSIRWKADEALLFGTGAGTPLGAYLSTGPQVTVAKESGQAAATIVSANLLKMIARMTPGSYGSAVWLLNNDVLPQVFGLNTANQMLYTPDFTRSPYGLLLGRPIIVTQHAKTLGTVGDIMLSDFRMYQAITKSGGIQTATSMHLYFDADATAFRATFRVDGAPKIATAISPANGSNTMSPFVQLDTRA